MRNEKKTAAIVGMVTTLSIALFIGVISVLSRWNVASEGWHLNIRYNFLNDILPGAPVKLAGGLEVGYVEEIKQDGITTVVVVYLNKDLKDKLPDVKETKFAIFTTGMMGQKYINLSVPQAMPEGQNVTYLKDGDTIRGVDPPSIDQIMLSFTSWFDGKNGGQVLAEVVKETQEFVRGLNGLVQDNRNDIRETVRLARLSINTLSSQLETLMVRLNSMTSDLQEISNKNKEDVKIMLQNMSYISEDFNTISKRIQQGKGSVGKFIHSEEIYNNMNEAAANAKVLFKKLRDRPHLLFYKQ